MATNNGINNLTLTGSVSGSGGNSISTLAGYPQISVNTATTLSSGAYGQQVVCTGSSAYTITLPAASNGKIIDFLVLTTSNALVTILPASGSIQGQSSYLLGSDESCRIYSDGTNWSIINSYLTPVSFLANLSNDQSITTGITTQIQFDTTSYNVGGFFNTSSYNFTPLYPGKYQIFINLLFTGTSANYATAAYIYKNGGLIAQTSMPFYNSVAGLGGTNYVSFVTNLNGTGDFISAYTLQNSGSSLFVSKLATTTYFSAFRISNF